MRERLNPNSTILVPAAEPRAISYLPLTTTPSHSNVFSPAKHASSPSKFVPSCNSFSPIFKPSAHSIFPPTHRIAPSSGSSLVLTPACQSVTKPSHSSDPHTKEPTKSFEPGKCPDASPFSFDSDAMDDSDDSLFKNPVTEYLRKLQEQLKSVKAESKLPEIYLTRISTLYF